MAATTLKDGTAIVIRAVRPDDKGRLVDSLRHSSRETMRRRFLSYKRELSPAELRYLTEVDGHDHIALVATLADDPECFIGVARCVRFADQRDTAELAIVVIDAWQGRGVGTELVRALAQAAVAVGIRRFAGTMLSENEAARRLMSRFGRELQARSEAGVREGLTVLDSSH